MRWHPLAPDKTVLQLKGFDKIPTDKREIEVNPLTIHAIMVPNHDNIFTILIFQIFKNLNDPAPLLINIKHPL